MAEGKELLDHIEQVQENYVELVDKVPTEDKIIMSREEASGLEPWEISEIVQGALGNLPEGLDGYVDSIFDVVYGAVSEALDKTRR